jgi:hypothetical protein
MKSVIAPASKGVSHKIGPTESHKVVQVSLEEIIGGSRSWA